MQKQRPRHPLLENALESANIFKSNLGHRTALAMSDRITRRRAFTNNIDQIAISIWIITEKVSIDH